MTQALDHIEGKYEILGKLNEGGMGAIYKVRHRLLDEVRVIKVMRPHLARDEELSTRFAREARTAIRLKHPGIAQLYDFALDPEGTAYIVMEYIEGNTLQHILKASGPPPLGFSLEIGCQALDALAFLHAKGFVHRDISPDNLMITVNAQGELSTKLIDLGIAKTLDDAGGLTATGMFLGKLRYAAPEQFGGAGSAAVDARADLYSFGVVLYELLTGCFPIAGDDQSSLIAGHLFHPPHSFDDTDPDGIVPADLRLLVLEALTKKPADRIADAQAFVRRLRILKDRYPLSQQEVGGGVIRSALDIAASDTLASDRGPMPDGQKVQADGSTQGRLDRQFGLGTTPTHHRTPPATVIAPGTTPISHQRRLPTILQHLATGSRRLLRTVAAIAGRRLMAAGNGRRLAAAAAVVALLFAAAMLFQSAIRWRSTASSSPLSGTLVLDAIPWAEVMSVTKRGERAVTLEAHQRFTPQSLNLPPGSYTVALTHPDADTPYTLDVEVAAGSFSRPAAPTLVEVDPDALLEALRR